MVGSLSDSQSGAFPSCLLLELMETIMALAAALMG